MVGVVLRARFEVGHHEDHVVDHDPPLDHQAGVNATRLMAVGFLSLGSVPA